MYCYTTRSHFKCYIKGQCKQHRLAVRMANTSSVSYNKYTCTQVGGQLQQIHQSRTKSWYLCNQHTLLYGAYCSCASNNYLFIYLFVLKLKLNRLQKLSKTGKRQKSSRIIAKNIDPSQIKRWLHVFFQNRHIRDMRQEGTRLIWLILIKTFKVMVIQP